jgi:hypothetical protein
VDGVEGAVVAGVTLSLVDAVRKFQWRGPVSFACRRDVGHPLPRVVVILEDDEVNAGPCALRCVRCGDRRVVTWQMATLVRRIVEHDWSVGWIKTKR